MSLNAGYLENKGGVGNGDGEKIQTLLADRRPHKIVDFSWQKGDAKYDRLIVRQYWKLKQGGLNTSSSSPDLVEQSNDTVTF